MANRAAQLMLFGAEELKRRTDDPQEAARIDIAQQALLDDGRDISFLHRGFCHCGLPLRRPADDLEAWKRSDGKFALTVRGGEYRTPDGGEIIIGVPYGPKARLLSMYIATELKDPRRHADDRWIEFGRVTEWLRSVGVTPSGGPRGSIAATKEQLIRLSFAHWNMMMAVDGEDRVWFHNEMLIETGTIAGREIEFWREEKYAKLSWPQALRLTDNAHRRLREQSVPIAAARLRLISNSAAAMDFFLYLGFRLPRIPAGEKVRLTWSDMMRQFGMTEQPVSEFRRTFAESLKNALAAYPEANVEITGEGLIMRRSDPAVPRKPLVAIMGRGSAAPKTGTDG